MVQRPHERRCLVQGPGTKCKPRCIGGQRSTNIAKFKILGKDDVPAGMDGGTSFTSVCFNTALYLPWLAGQCLKHGVVLKRGVAGHVSDAANMHHSGRRADLVVNCTGLSSLKLGGVEDKKLFPGRGQIVVVRSDPGYGSRFTEAVKLLTFTGICAQSPEQTMAQRRRCISCHEPLEAAPS